jgi:DNA-binding MarR family transcriptional regulator
VPIAFGAFLLSWTLPEIELRKSIRTSEPAENLGIPEPRTSLGEIQRILERAASQENRRELYETLAARAGLDLDPRACWMLYRLADRPDCSLEEVGARLNVDAERLEAGVESLVQAGMVERRGPDAECSLVITAEGRRAIDRLAVARRESMTELLEGWDPDDHPEVVEMVRNLARSLLADDDKLLADARPASV